MDGATKVFNAAFSAGVVPKCEAAKHTVLLSCASLSSFVLRGSGRADLSRPGTTSPDATRYRGLDFKVHSNHKITGQSRQWEVEAF